MKPLQVILLACISLNLVQCNTNNNNNHFASQVVDKPQVFLSEIFTGEHNEFNVSFNPANNKMILFTRRIGDGKQRIYQTFYENNSWTTPVITSFSTDRDEIAMFTPDGNEVYFGSARPIPGRPNLGNFDMNIWKTTYSNGIWSDPYPLSQTINKVQSEGDEWPLHNLSYFTTADNKTFYTGTLVPDSKGMDIFTTTRQGNSFSKLQKISNAINTEEYWEYAPIISPDGRYLFTQVYKREGGKGGDDIYVSKKDDKGQWLPSVNLGEIINSDKNECPLGFSPDGKYFLFSAPVDSKTTDPDAKSRPYIISTSSLQLDKLFD